MALKTEEHKEAIKKALKLFIRDLEKYIRYERECIKRREYNG